MKSVGRFVGAGGIHAQSFLYFFFVNFCSVCLFSSYVGLISFMFLFYYSF